MKKRIISVIMAALLLISLGGCGKEAQTAEEGGTAQTGGEAETDTKKETAEESGISSICVETNSDMSNLAPSAVQNDAHFRCGNLIYEKLLNYDKDGNVIPGLATSFEISDDLKLTLHIRENVKFHTGQTLSAKDVLFSLKLANDSVNFSRNTKYMDLESAEIVDDYTLVVPLNQKTVFLEDDLAKVEIASEEAYQEDPEHLNNKEAGTGPYYVSDWQVGSSITMRKFEEYWDNEGQKQNVDEIVFKVISEASQRTIALETGDVQVLYDVPRADIKTLQENSGITVDGKESDGCFALYFNCSEGKPTADVRVRQAIAYAIDTVAVANIAYGDGGTAATTISNRTDIEWEASMADLEPLYPYNPEKAKELLAEAGYADGFELTVIGDNSKEGIKDAIQIIQNQLEQVGITLNVDLQEASVFNTSKFDKDAWDLQYDFYGIVRTTMAFFNNQFDQRAGDRSFYRDETMQAMLEEAIPEYDKQKIQDLAEYFTEQLPAYPMVDVIKYYAYKTGIENFNIYTYNVMYPGEFTFTEEYSK